MAGVVEPTGGVVGGGRCECEAAAGGFDGGDSLEPAGATDQGEVDNVRRRPRLLTVVVADGVRSVILRDGDFAGRQKGQVKDVAVGAGDLAGVGVAVDGEVEDNLG